MVRTEVKSLLIYSMEILTTPLFRFKIYKYLSFAKDRLYDSITFQSCFLYFLLRLLM